MADFLDLFNTSTQRAYGHALRRFFTCVNGERPADLDAVAAAYLNDIAVGDRDPADDLVKAMAKLQKKYSPSTVGLTRAAVTGFLLENKIELTRVDERRIKSRTPRKSVIVEEETFSREHLRKLLPILMPRDRAVVLVLLTSGGRIGEVLQLRIKDVDLDSIPARVYFRRETTKAKQARFTFITPEAVEAVRAWLLVRDEYLRASINKNRGLVAVGRAKEKDPDDPRLFPFHRSAFDTAWDRALERTGLNRRCETTGHHTLHPHGLRKYFRTQLGAAGGPDLAEVLMGHSGYLTTAYRRPTEQELADGYLKHCGVLSVVDSGDLTQQLAEQRATMDEIREKNAALEEEVAILRADMDQVKTLRAMLAKNGELDGSQ